MLQTEIKGRRKIVLFYNPTKGGVATLDKNWKYRYQYSFALSRS